MKWRQVKLFGKKAAPVPTKMEGITLVPRRAKHRRIEFENQKALFEWVDEIWARSWTLRQRYPELDLLHASAAGEKKDRATAIKLLLMGVRRGFPDVHLPVARGGYIGLWIEMKSDKGRLSEDQKRVRVRLEAERNAYLVCRDWETARDAILAYLDRRLRRGDENDVAEAATARGPGGHPGPR